MHILVDATPLLLRSAGVKNYVYHWISHLRRVAGDHSISTFPIGIPLEKLDHEQSLAGPLATLGGLARLHLLNGSRLRWSCRGADVFHASHQCLNPPRNTRLTATIYDMTCWLMPELHSPANVRVGRRFGEQVLAHADGLMAISESTRQDAINILGLPPGLVEVIYPGVADAFFEATPETARRKYKLSRPYVLFVGTIEPRKNVDALLDAYGSLSASTRDEFELVVVGPRGWAKRSTLAKLGGPGIRYLGYVPESDLPGINAGAAVFAYPSLYEGFGFPVAQAMAAGVPVVTSNVSSLSEIAATAALLVDPRSVVEIRSAMEKLLRSPALRCDLGENGRRRAQEFRWETTAKKSLRFFEKVVGSDGSPWAYQLVRRQE